MNKDKIYCKNCKHFNVVPPFGVQCLKVKQSTPIGPKCSDPYIVNKNNDCNSFEQKITDAKKNRFCFWLR